MQCTNNNCTKVYKVKNENLCQVDTYDQAQVMDGSKNIAWDPWNAHIMSPDGDFIPNDIDLWYYKDPVLANISSQFAYANERKPLIIGTDFNWGKGNDFEAFRKYSNFTCRFTSTSDASKVRYTEAIMETAPIGQYNNQSLPDQIRCRTPKWGAPDTANLEISVNGQDYFGSY